MSKPVSSNIERLGQIKDRALNLLSRREYSRFELTIRLSRKFDKQLVEIVLDELAINQLQCDQRFALSFIRSSVYKSHGPKKIRYQLKQKGVPDAIASAAMAECEQSIDWVDLAVDLRSRRFGLDKPESREGWAKQARFLLSRGYAMDCIEQAMSIVKTP